MTWIIIALSEALLIVALLCIIREYAKEHRRLRRQVFDLYGEMDYRLSIRIHNTLTHAVAIRDRLSDELYPKSEKKNSIVRSTCTAFYEALVRVIK